MHGGPGPARHPRPDQPPLRARRTSPNTRLPFQQNRLVPQAPLPSWSECIPCHRAMLNTISRFPPDH